MKDFELFSLLRGVLLAGFAEQGLNGVAVMRSYTSGKATAPQSPAIIMHRIDTQRVGWQSRNFSLTGNVARDTAIQNHAVTFQFNALVPVSMDAELTANDLLDMAAMILQSRQMIETCRAAGVGIQHVGQITSNYVQNENDDWEPEPSFDIIVAVKKELVTSVGEVTAIDAKIYPV